MLRRTNQKFCSEGQSYVEYVLMIAAVSFALIAMTTYIKRSVQGMTLLVADQIGNQGEGDQRYSEQGHLMNSVVQARTSIQKTESGYGAYGYQDRTTTETFTVTNLGFTSNLAR